MQEEPKLWHSCVYLLVSSPWTFDQPYLFNSVHLLKLVWLEWVTPGQCKSCHNIAKSNIGMNDPCFTMCAVFICMQAAASKSDEELQILLNIHRGWNADIWSWPERANITPWQWRHRWHSGSSRNWLSMDFYGIDELDDMIQPLADLYQKFWSLFLQN